jgi:hypothetical protein
MSRRLVLGLLCSWAVLAGCSSSSPTTVLARLDPTQEKLIKIKLAYSHFLSEKGTPPRSAEDLRPLLASGGDNPDDILRSSRDAQPFVICWGVDINAKLPWAKTVPVLAYEKEGVGGSRYVLTAVRSIGLMSEQEFREASFPPGHPGVSK